MLKEKPVSKLTDEVLIKELRTIWQNSETFKSSLLGTISFYFPKARAERILMSLNETGSEENKPIKIFVSKGLVEEVQNIPKGYEYEIIDKDTQEG